MYTVEELKGFVNKAISEIVFNNEDNRLYEPVKYIMSAGGKRLRPVMALMACNLYRENVDSAILPAIGLEVFHNFTLVHDDIMDGASIRRGSPTVHEKWDMNQAILSGDVMAFIANDCISQAPGNVFPEVIKVFNKAAIDVCRGQQFDMDFEKTTFVSHNDYLVMVELKTAVLIAASLKIGGIIGGAGRNDAERLYSFGKNLGLAFQMQDDLLDAYGDPAIFGKKTGGDIVSNKKTILLIRALELANTGQLKVLHDQLALAEFDPDEKIQKVKTIFDELKVGTYAESIASELIEQAFYSLNSLEVDTAQKEILNRFALEMIGRIR